MGRETAIDPLREQTERHIAKRLRLSRWLRRGVAAACLGAGLYAVQSPDITKPENRDAIIPENLDDTAAMMVIGSSGIALIFENAFLQRTCGRRIEEHRAARRAQSAASNVIRVRFGMAPLQAEKNTISPPSQEEPPSTRDVLAMTGFYGAPLAAGFGIPMALGPHVNQHFSSEYGVAYTAVGVTLLGVAAVTSYAARGIHSGIMESYRQQLDDIDEQTRFRDHQGRSLV